MSIFSENTNIFKNFNVKSDWTKPLRGSVALDIVVIRKL